MTEALMDWLALHGSLIVMLVFMTVFLGFAVWAYRPANKAKLDQYGQIPFKERPQGE